MVAVLIFLLNKSVLEFVEINTCFVVLNISVNRSMKQTILDKN